MSMPPRTYLTRRPTPLAKTRQASRGVKTSYARAILSCSPRSRSRPCTRPPTSICAEKSLPSSSFLTPTPCRQRRLPRSPPSARPTPRLHRGFLAQILVAPPACPDQPQNCRRIMAAVLEDLEDGRPHVVFGVEPGEFDV